MRHERFDQFGSTDVRRPCGLGVEAQRGHSRYNGGVQQRRQRDGAALHKHLQVAPRLHVAGATGRRRVQRPIQRVNVDFTVRDIVGRHAVGGAVR